MYRVLWDTDNCCDSFESPSFGQAKQDALDLLLEWESQEMCTWHSTRPLPDQIDDWNYMIDNCCVEVIEYDDDSDENCEAYHTVWEPSDEDLKQIGWVYFDELNWK